MKRSDIMRLLPHIALIFGSVLLVVGFFMLVRVEEAKTRDIIRMQEVIDIKQELYRYYLSHASYPSSFNSGNEYEYLPLGSEGETRCESASTCPRYALRFTLQTDLVFSRGPHILTPEGVQ